MSITVHEVLMNAQMNLENAQKFGVKHPFVTLATEQLTNALKAIKNGANLDDDMADAGQEG